MVHYDLSWNPTRHEQREGRVDRFLQPKPTVAVVTYYGEDNPVDGLVLRVLLRKHKEIRDTLGISVPLPQDANSVQNALLEGLLLNPAADNQALEQLALFSEEYLAPQRTRLHDEWDRATDQEKRSRTIFAQATIRPEEVAAELEAARQAIGRGVDVEAFVTNALTRQGAVASNKNGLTTYDLDDVRPSIRDVAGLGDRKRLEARFDPPRRDHEEVLSRTHPVVDGLASWVADTTLDPQVPPPSRPAARCGVIRTTGVTQRTTALLVRVRHDIGTQRSEPLLAEEVRVVAYAGSAESPVWLGDAEAEGLLSLQPTGNVAAEDKAQRIDRFTSEYASLEPRLEGRAVEWGSQLGEAHQRVREAARQSGRVRVQTRLPVDVLGIYIFLPQAVVADADAPVANPGLDRQRRRPAAARDPRPHQGG